MCVPDGSTNMALADADQLRQSLEKHDCQIGPALQDFQDARLEATSREVRPALGYLDSRIP